MLSQILRFAVQSAFPETKFYDDDDCDYEEVEEVLYCKNNVCVHPSTGKDKETAGYFTIKSRTRKSGHIRLIVSWTPNSHFKDDPPPKMISESTKKSKLLISDPSKYDTLEFFSVDLSEMKIMKLFYEEDEPNSGQFVIGNYENHYKVFNFNYGGLNRVTQILEDWPWCVGERRSQEEVRKRCFVVISKTQVRDDCYVEEGRYDPMSAETWKTFLNSSGQIEDVANFRRAVFFGGLSPEVRKDAWKFLLGYFTYSSTSQERADMRKEKEAIYLKAQNIRLSMTDEEYVQFWKVVQCTVDKDVPRTDRSHPYFAGEGNPNIEVMRSILLNYAIHNPEIGYSQGMSDLLSPVLAALQDEVDAFWCFAALMEASVFVTSPKDDAMDKQLAYLRELVRMMQPKFYAHLLIEDDGLDMLFCHRWLLLCFKREFYDEQVLLMWEACWSRYQTDYFHLFLCVAIMQEYGSEVLDWDMQMDEMLHFFTDLSMKMDGNKVLRTARQLLLKFRKLPFIPCSLRGLLSGPGIWDSAPLPKIECHCHGDCYHGDGTVVVSGVQEKECCAEDIGFEVVPGEELGSDDQVFPRHDNENLVSKTITNKENDQNESCSPEKDEREADKNCEEGSNDDIENRGDIVERTISCTEDIQKDQIEISYQEKYEKELSEKNTAIESSVLEEQGLSEGSSITLEIETVSSESNKDSVSQKGVENSEKDASNSHNDDAISREDALNSGNGDVISENTSKEPLPSIPDEVLEEFQCKRDGGLDEKEVSSTENDLMVEKTQEVEAQESSSFKKTEEYALEEKPDDHTNYKKTTKR